MAIEWVSSKPAKLQGKRQAGVCWLEHFCMYQKAMQRLYWTEGVGPKAAGHLGADTCSSRAPFSRNLGRLTFVITAAQISSHRSQEKKSDIGSERAYCGACLCLPARKETESRWQFYFLLFIRMVAPAKKSAARQSEVSDSLRCLNILSTVEHFLSIS